MKVLAIRMFVGWLVLVEAVTVAVGWWFGNHPLLGGWRFGSYIAYFPGQFVLWYQRLHPADVWILNYAVYLCLTLFVAVAVVGAVKWQKMQQRGDASRITSSRDARARFR